MQDWIWDLTLDELWDEARLLGVQASLLLPVSQGGLRFVEDVGYVKPKRSTQTVQSTDLGRAGPS